jgi:hypothetical protein
VALMCHWQPMFCWEALLLHVPRSGRHTGMGPYCRVACSA